MLQYESYHHLNENESKIVLEQTKLAPNKRDGPDETPFEIRFSNMVLNKI